MVQTSGLGALHGMNTWAGYVRAVSGVVVVKGPDPDPVGIHEHVPGGHSPGKSLPGDDSDLSAVSISETTNRPGWRT